MFTSIKDSPIHKGLVVTGMSPDGTVGVYIPTAPGAITPNGPYKFIGKNMGGVLHGEELSKIMACTWPCQVATKLTSGGWIKTDPATGYGVFNNKHGKKDKDKNNIYNYLTNGEAKPDGIQNPPNKNYNTATPSKNFCAVGILEETCGDPVEAVGNLPPGDYPNVQNQKWVLVAFVNGQKNPIVFATLTSKEENQTLFG